MIDKTPERIHNWQHSQLSIARHYGGITFNGAEYRIAYDEEGQPLVRVDKRKRGKKPNAELRGVSAHEVNNGK